MKSASSNCTIRGKAGLFTALLLLALASSAILAQSRNVPVTLEGTTGNVRIFSEKPLAVQTETTEKSVRWTIACTTVAKAAPGMKELFDLVPGGLALELPLSTRPSMTWGTDGITIRWSLTPAAPEAKRGLFDTETPPAYPLGPGDKLQINVYNVDNMNEAVVVDPDGTVTFPVLDKVSVEGLTVNQLQVKLSKLLAQYVKEPQVNIQLLEYGSRYVNVLGNVLTPGRIPLKGAFRVLDAISQAGGFADKSGDVEIQRRDGSGKVQSKVLNKEDLLAGSEKSNIYVLDQDVINVQPPKSVYVSGEVKSPGALPYAKDMTLLKAITLSGGYTQWAKKDKVDILRDVNGKPTVIHVNAEKIEKAKIEDVPLQPNDHVVVRERKFF